MATPVSPLSSAPSPLVDASCGPFSPLSVSASERANDKAQKTKLRAAFEQTENGKKLLQNSNNVKSARRHKHTHTRHTQRETQARTQTLAAPFAEQQQQQPGRGRGTGSDSGRGRHLNSAKHARPFCMLCVYVSVCVFWSFPLLRRRLSVNAKSC